MHFRPSSKDIAIDMSIDALPDSRLRALLSDCTICLLQQMYFWGKDVTYADGNLLCEHGFERNRSLGLQGTSCYRKPWKDGFIELHGACAGWYPNNVSEGFAFIRPFRRVYRYVAPESPIPGKWKRTDLLRGNPHSIYEAAEPFMEWWLAYERWITEHTCPLHREECYLTYRKVPATMRHLPPEEAQQWLGQFSRHPGATPRLRERRYPPQKSTQDYANLRVRNHSPRLVRGTEPL